MLIKNADIDGEIRDIRVADGVVAQIGTSLPNEEAVIDADGCAVIRGLTDNHIHLCAYAAARDSLHLKQLSDISDAHLRVPIDQMLRVVDYHEDLHGRIDKNVLDSLAPGRIVRVQHQSGRAWVFSSAALRDAGLVHETGELIGEEGTDLPNRVDAQPDLGRASQALACVGVTRLTDATPYRSLESASLLIDAVSVGAVRQSVSFTGGPEIAASVPSGFSQGPVKIVVGDHDLPNVELLVEAVNTARAHGRNVAFHCVTTAALALIVAAMREVGPSQFTHLDRIEHAAVVPNEYVDELKQLRLVIVTQPGFVHARGDRYLRTVDRVDLPFLYRCGSLVAAGIAVYGSSDAPYGPVDPWLAMRTAMERRSASGAAVGKDESISALSALRAYVNSPQERWRDEVGPCVGDLGDLVILGESLKGSLSNLDSVSVRATVIGGDLVFSRD